MQSTNKISSDAIARLLSNPELTPEQRDVYVALSQGKLTEEQAIQQVMVLETARNAQENTTATNPTA